MLLCLCMVTVFLPTVALAAETDVTNTGVNIWPGKNGTDGPTPSGTYKAGSGTVAWDLDTLTLTLTDATINATEAQCCSSSYR